MILCDIGNTSFDFFIKGSHKKYSMDYSIPKFDEKVYFISVNEEGSKKLLSSNPDAKNIEDLIIFDTKYQGLGIDRTLACYFEKDCVIVDGGSAITVDIMEEGKHKGGFILAGLKFYKEIYPKISKLLELDLELDVSLDKIPLDTKSAIFFATLKSIVLPIEEIRENKKIIFTGGDGKFLSKYFENSIYEENLIFKNMKRLIDENKGNK